MKDLCSAVLDDPYAFTGNLGRDENFRQFVNLLPTTLGPVSDRTLSVSTLMEAQHHALAHLTDNIQVPPEWLTDIQMRVSQYNQAGDFLTVKGQSEDEFCLESGMTPTEIARMRRGEMTVGSFLRERPAVIIAPLLLVLKMRRVQ